MHPLASPDVSLQDTHACNIPAIQTYDLCTCSCSMSAPPLWHRGTLHASVANGEGSTRTCPEGQLLAHPTAKWGPLAHASLSYSDLHHHEALSTPIHGIYKQGRAQQSGWLHGRKQKIQGRIRGTHGVSISHASKMLS